MIDLHYLTVADASRRIARGRLSPVDLVDASLDRLSRVVDVNHVVQRSPAIGVDGGVHVGPGPQRGDDDRDLVPDASLQILI